MCAARRITICFPVVSSPVACTLLKQQAALVIGFILFLPLVCVDQLRLFCSPIRDFLVRRPHLPCCRWVQTLVPGSRKTVFPSHTGCRAKHDTGFMVQDLPWPCPGFRITCSALSLRNNFLITPPLFHIQLPCSGKTCNSSYPEPPPSASSPLANSPTRTISCQSRQEASSSLPTRI